jgi:hypothetical protein
MHCINLVYEGKSISIYFMKEMHVVPCIKISLLLMMKNSTIFIAIISLSFLIASCKDDYSICNPVKDVKFIGGFYQRIGGADVPSPAPNFSLSLLNNTSFIYTNQPNTIEFGMPLNELSDTSRYVLSLINGQPKDTLTIVYSSQKSTSDGNACGIVVVHTISGLYSTRNTVDSVKLMQPLVNTNPMQNAKIYF